MKINNGGFFLPLGTVWGHAECWNYPSLSQLLERQKSCTSQKETLMYLFLVILNGYVWGFSIFLTVNKSHRKTKPNNELIPITSIVCVSKHWYTLLHCATELHSCPGAIKVDQWATLLHCVSHCFITMSTPIEAQSHLAVNTKWIMQCICVLISHCVLLFDRHLTRFWFTVKACNV